MIGDASSFSWPGSESPVFCNASAKKTTTANAGEEEGDGDKCVDLKTGEEDEEEMFRQRARLYRYEVNKWKERGVGDMKIMRNTLAGNSPLSHSISLIKFTTAILAQYR